MMIGDVGRHVPAMSSALRVRAEDELRAWGGERLVRGKRVLDVGCGDGRIAIAIAPVAASLEAIDPDPDAVAAARKTARKAGVRNARFAVGAAQKLHYPDHAFDVAVLSWAL